MHEIQLCDNKSDPFTSTQQNSIIRRLSLVPCVMLNGWIAEIIFALAFHPSLQGGELSLCTQRRTWDDVNEGLPLSVRVVRCHHDSWRDGLRSAKKIRSSQERSLIVWFALRGCWKVLRGEIWAQSNKSNLILVFPLFIWAVWSLVTLCNC